jgi:hypothetical protein
MTPIEPYSLVYAPVTKEHLKFIHRGEHSLIRMNIEEQLKYEPEKETRNRKPLIRPAESGAKWELRFGPQNRFRVFYRVVRHSREVIILAIGRKIGERLLIAGKEVRL